MAVFFPKTSAFLPRTPPISPSAGFGTIASPPISASSGLGRQNMATMLSARALPLLVSVPGFAFAQQSSDGSGDISLPTAAIWVGGILTVTALVAALHQALRKPRSAVERVEQFGRTEVSVSDVYIDPTEYEGPALEIEDVDVEEDLTVLDPDDPDLEIVEGALPERFVWYKGGVDLSAHAGDAAFETYAAQYEEAFDLLVDGIEYRMQQKVVAAYQALHKMKNTRKTLLAAVAIAISFAKYDKALELLQKARSIPQSAAFDCM
ncbi:MAG: hypothetical protein COV43_02760 [Deltaproteobacteria bacterium CG11_big_fil_rev_8_21_14_0_20_42_23]|nr:MAG: hypothetical protein COV43_02760 [Deltaproteobacteria bacterium CG11_big_fil_rev_8_21_14_0_20_42_23]PJC63832.1 MAG: hypothetical protein CO021_07470 [Deltaproteobacteria bacterium CG_4_9_14_0_2_um_filter_42_21]